MDSFTVAIVIGGAVVLVVLLGMIVIDRGAPPEKPEASEPTRASSVSRAPKKRKPRS